jgi:hypothetical protein
MKFIVRCVLLVCLPPVFSGCGGDDSKPPTDVHGDYTLSATNGPSTCPLPGWTENSTTSGIPFKITQNGASVSGDVGGAGQVFLGIYCGNSHLEGSVSGPDIDMRLAGTNSLSSGSCAFTINAHLVATVVNDELTGTISYAPDTNSSQDCAAVRTCTASMSLKATRPPTQ